MKDPVLIVMELVASQTIGRDDARALLAALRSDATAPTRPEPRGTDEPIAVVGVASRLPEAPTYSDFWPVLEEGRDCSRRLPPARRDLCDVMGIENPEYLFGSWIDDIDQFDHEFFGITPADAFSMDPTQRVFLQTAYHCLEDAGWAGRIRGTRTGVYGSFDGGDYRLAVPADSPSDVPGRIGSFAASRLSFWLDLSGPASVTSCTCSSSALAVHLACQGIRSGDCDMAIVGGANILSFPVQRPSLLADASGIMAGDATCHPFAADAKGIGRGEGVAALMLRPLSAALADGDRIRAVIPASAVNNDGHSAMLTAPDPAAQAELLISAWAKAGWDPKTVDYIEAHGTGTQLGDPIEIKALHEAARAHDVPAQSIALGTVKGNIGHLLDGAAGLAGIVKALHVLEHREVPPTVNLTEPSRHIDFLSAPVFIPTEPWALPVTEDRPLRAGVSCFGFNGTNVHLLLEGAPTQDTEPATTGPETTLVPLSARSPEALERLVALMAEQPINHTVSDLAWTLTVGREQHPRRVALLARTPDDVRRLCHALAEMPSDQWHTVSGVVTDSSRPVDGQVTDAWERARSWVAGEDLKPSGTGRIVDAPLYPFARNSFWPRPTTGEEGTSPSPSSPMETILSIVEDVLGMDSLTPEDSFLALGGSSLAAIKIQVEVRRNLGVEVDMVDILGAETLAEFYSAVVEGQTP
ncbi:MAG TPA: hypothetical protein H9881_10870 [Candidatus Stackebrandtia excrementipullorum]|nr:hypothetical protein [Candidatus Stackebrandtia excrementipullorum]